MIQTKPTVYWVLFWLVTTAFFLVTGYQNFPTYLPFVLISASLSLAVVWSTIQIWEDKSWGWCVLGVFLPTKLAFYYAIGATERMWYVICGFILFVALYRSMKDYESKMRAKIAECEQAEQFARQESEEQYERIKQLAN